MTDETGDYEVGYGKPPKATQFQSGQSGNPGGRQPGSKSLAKLVEKELNGKITVTENGKRRRLSRREAMVKQLINKALAGDLRAMSVILGMMLPRDNGGTDEAGYAFDAINDHEVLETYLNQLLSAEGRATDAPDATSF